jgi:3-oxoacyl-[acyl-carrier protein] reductase
MRLAGKIAIVTGAAQGIGRAYARVLAQEGAAVVCADLRREGAEETAAQIRAAGGQAIAQFVDIGEEAATQAMAEAAIRTYGGIDILVNNAALFYDMERHGGLMQVPLDYWRHFLDINVTGALRCVRAVVPAMRQRGGGRIVNQSSAAAYLGAGYYGVAKLMLNGLTLSLSRELGPARITVNAIAPGPTETEAMRKHTAPAVLDRILAGMPLQRIGTPADLARVLCWLVSDEAAWVTGQTISVDGGQVMRI